MAKSTKPKSATSYSETAFGILPHSELIQLEGEGVKKALDYILKLRFVWIHPFKDYNGRVARLLTILLSLNLGLPILEIKAGTGKDRERYVKAMKAADEHDYSKLEKLIANALKESLEKV